VTTPWVGQATRRNRARITRRQTPRSRWRQDESTERVSSRPAAVSSQCGQASRRRRNATVTTTTPGSNATADPDPGEGEKARECSGDTHGRSSFCSAASAPPNVRPRACHPPIGRGRDRRLAGSSACLSASEQRAGRGQDGARRRSRGRTILTPTRSRLLLPHMSTETPVIRRCSRSPVPHRHPHRCRKSQKEASLCLVVGVRLDRMRARPDHRRRPGVDRLSGQSLL